jgi:hypothetical protein
VVIAVITVRMMQMTIDQIVDVITVRDWFVSTSRAMHVSRIVSSAVVIGSAVCRICRTYWNSVLFNHAVIAHPMQVAIVQVIGVILMLDRCVSAARTVDVIVVMMRMVCHCALHLELFYRTIQKWLAQMICE